MRAWMRASSSTVRNGIMLSFHAASMLMQAISSSMSLIRLSSWGVVPVSTNRSRSRSGPPAISRHRLASRITHRKPCPQSKSGCSRHRPGAVPKLRSDRPRSKSRCVNSDHDGSLICRSSPIKKYDQTDQKPLRGGGVRLLASRAGEVANRPALSMDERGESWEHQL